MLVQTHAVFAMPTLQTSDFCNFSISNPQPLRNTDVRILCLRDYGEISCGFRNLRTDRRQILFQAVSSTEHGTADSRMVAFSASHFDSSGAMAAAGRPQCLLHVETVVEYLYTFV